MGRWAGSLGSHSPEGKPSPQAWGRLLVPRPCRGGPTSGSGEGRAKAISTQVEEPTEAVASVCVRPSLSEPFPAMLGT